MENKRYKKFFTETRLIGDIASQATKYEFYFKSLDYIDSFISFLRSFKYLEGENYRFIPGSYPGTSAGVIYFKKNVYGKTPEFYPIKQWVEKYGGKLFPARSGIK